ncbi:MAG TPA: DUF5678 domain-containing protein [Candidatus Nanoarchaeia archaeon]|nr:DUF5678 domain-containing protein [Candidatus Nanoarchaeia archaeon]
MAKGTIDDAVKERRTPKSVGEFSKKFYDKYVAVPLFSSPFADSSVVSYGKDLIKVHAQAIKKGYLEPVIIYVPDPAVPQIFDLN